MKLGTIILWYGSIATTPYGWHLCDGTLDTPDLRNIFIVGANDAYAIGAGGGAINHTHPFASVGHLHDLEYPPLDIGSDGECYRRTDIKTLSGTTNNGNVLPPYHGLAYIMKLVPSRHNG